MIEKFIAESQLLFEEMQLPLSTLHHNSLHLPSIQTLHALVDPIHKLVQFFGLSGVEPFAEHLNHVLELVVHQKLTLSAELSHLITQAIEELQPLIYALSENQAPPQPTTSLEALKGVLISGVPQHTIEAPKPSYPEPVTSNRESDEELGMPLMVEGWDESLFGDLLSQFVLEAEEHLRHIEQQLLHLDQHPQSMGTIHELFRAMHSIKGTSVYVNLDPIHELSHHLEHLLGALREGELSYSPAVGDVLFKNVDFLKQMVEYVKTHQFSKRIHLGPSIEAIHALIPKTTPLAELEASQALSESTKHWETFLASARQQKEVLMFYQSLIEEGALDVQGGKVLQRALLTLRKSAEYCQFTTLAESIQRYEEQVLFLGRATQAPNALWFKEILLPLHHKVMEALESFFVEESSKASDAESSSRSAEASPHAEESASLAIRVDAKELDQIMNRVGELVVAKNTVAHLAQQCQRLEGAQPLLNPMKQVEHKLRQIVNSLQQHLVTLRLLPMEMAFQRIPRIVRDIARKTGKQIHLELEGAEVMVDKNVVEFIADPLAHMVRNSCDHGIEAPEVRQRAGKPIQGRITVSAQQSSSGVSVRIQDDGQGLNLKSIQNEALRQGLITVEQLNSMSHHQILQLIFTPGFSTSTAVSNISGRGVGLDVVMSNVKQLRGSLEIDSEWGRGTWIDLKLPLSFAIRDVLLVEANEQPYGFPLEQITETLQLPHPAVQASEEHWKIQWRDTTIPVFSLAALLQMEAPASAPPLFLDEEELVSILVFSDKEQHWGVRVDQLFSQKEVYMRPLPPYLSKLPGIQGTAILGDGAIMFIAEPETLAELKGNS